MVDDTVVSSQGESLFDPEFATEGPALTFQDQGTGNLWVCAIDAAKGTWTPLNGKQTLVDQRLSLFAGTLQGPEWAIDSGGSRIVYTKNVRGVPAIGVAKRVENGWQTFVHFTVSNSKTSREQTVRGNADVWLAEISNAGKILWFRQVNDPKTTRIKDSEVLVTDSTGLHLLRRNSFEWRTPHSPVRQWDNQ